MSATTVFRGIACLPSGPASTQATSTPYDPARDEKLDLLAEVLLDVRSLSQPGYRLTHTMKIVAQLIDLGEHDTARTLIDENTALAKDLDSSYSRLSYTRLIVDNRHFPDNCAAAACSDMKRFAIGIFHDDFNLA